MNSSEKKTTKDHEINSRLLRMKNMMCPSFKRANELDMELKNGLTKPFESVTWLNIGDGQSVGQPPITFVRQMMAILSYPKLLNSPDFPDDVKEKARKILDACCGKSIGSYSDRAGIELIRKHVAEFIEKRDGVVSDPNNIILCSGASFGIRSVMNLFAVETDGKKAGVLIPVPRYFFYPILMDDLDMYQIDYYLDESKNWGLDTEELTATLIEARKKCNPKVLVVINPGNPNGTILSRKNMEEIIRFAYRENLILMADEVYQDNVHHGLPFYSFKKVLVEIGPPYSNVELASFHSASKGYLGECGLRGSFVELFNFSPKAVETLLKYVSGQLCPNVPGQIAIECLVNPPVEGEESYPLYAEEKNSIIKTHSEKAEMIVEMFNSMEGVVCNPLQGALYAFPRIKLPPKAIEAAEKAGLQPDTFYTLQVVENTGICLVDGSSLGQKAGTYHFRCTILPRVDVVKSAVRKLKEFHDEFMRRYQ